MCHRRSWLLTIPDFLHSVHERTCGKSQEEQEGRIDNELAVVLSSIAVACKQIASMVNRAGISNLTGAAGAQNISGEDQKKLDVVSNEVFSNCLRASGRTVSLTARACKTVCIVECSSRALCI